MAANRTICHQNNIDYLTIRKAMCQGARTVEETKAVAGVCGVCDGCRSELGPILASVCGCRGVSLQAVVDAVNSGARTTEAVADKTGAGADCGRCKVLVQNVIDLGR